MHFPLFDQFADQGGRVLAHHLFATASGHVAARYASFAVTQGYFERPRFYTINFFVVTFNVILTFTVGAVWWKMLGYY